jgi:hypothetical protein
MKLNCDAQLEFQDRLVPKSTRLAGWAALVQVLGIAARQLATLAPGEAIAGQSFPKLSAHRFGCVENCAFSAGPQNQLGGRTASSGRRRGFRWIRRNIRSIRTAWRLRQSVIKQYMKYGFLRSWRTPS